MIITLVMDQYGLLNNGTTATAMRFAEILRSHGHTVRIVTCVEGVEEDNVYVVPKRQIPIVMKIVRSHGMELAKPDKNILLQAMTGADVVHFFLPFKLAKVAKAMADKLNIPTTAAFHLQPENVTYNVGLGHWKWLQKVIYKSYKKFYDRFDHVHVPSKMIHDILINHGYGANLHIISNGVLPEFKKMDSSKPEEFKDKFVVIMSARFGAEKRQDLLIEAINKSKHRNEIQLLLCGRGPQEKKLRALAAKLLPDNPPIFKFCSREELIKTLNYSDLYAHTSDIEIEAISCMEAFSCGVVPVISDSEESATKQFALDKEKCTFHKGDSTDLAKKIDYLFEHTEERLELSKRYLEYSEEFRLEKCITRLENMLIQAVNEHRRLNAQEGEIAEEIAFTEVADEKDSSEGA